MARQSILLNLSPQLDIKSIHPHAFIDAKRNNLIIGERGDASQLAECISIVQSVPNETQLIINIISTEGTLIYI